MILECLLLRLIIGIVLDAKWLPWHRAIARGSQPRAALCRARDPATIRELDMQAENHRFTLSRDSALHWHWIYPRLACSLWLVLMAPALQTISDSAHKKDHDSLLVQLTITVI